MRQGKLKWRGNDRLDRWIVYKCDNWELTSIPDASKKVPPEFLTINLVANSLI
jgi:hypothetical protein